MNETLIDEDVIYSVNIKKHKHSASEKYYIYISLFIIFL